MGVWISGRDVGLVEIQRRIEKIARYVQSFAQQSQQVGDECPQASAPKAWSAAFAAFSADCWAEKHAQS
jgi:hypothetical protein